MNQATKRKVPKRIAQTIINSLKGGGRTSYRAALYYSGAKKRDRGALA